MAEFNPYKAYEQATFGTADRGRLVVQAYDATIRALKEVRRSISENDFSARTRNVDLAFELISELRKSLNPEQGGELALSLNALYEYFSRELVTANAYNDGDRLDPVINMMTDLRNTWEEARKKEMQSG
jgi:flagellar protein FliS